MTFDPRLDVRIEREAYEAEQRMEAQWSLEGDQPEALRDGHPRRMYDARNAWRKMSDGQREEFLDWIVDCGAARAHLLDRLTLEGA